MAQATPSDPLPDNCTFMMHPEISTLVTVALGKLPSKKTGKKPSVFHNLRTKQEISHKYKHFLVGFVNYLEIQFLT